MRWNTALVVAAFMVGIFAGTNGKDCFGKTDVVFVLDGSGSVGESNFDKQKLFVEDVVDGLNIKGGSRVGVVAFNQNPYHSIELGSRDSTDKIKEDINAVPFHGGVTGTGKAIKAARAMYQRHGDPNIPKVIVVMTDGASTRPRDTIKEATAAKNDHIKIIAIGIGNGPNETELKNMATSPSTQNLITIKDFSELKNFVKKLAGKACSPPEPIPCLDEASQKCKDGKADIVFVMDESASLTSSNFNRIKSFVKKVIEQLAVKKEATRVGVITYSTKIRRHFTLGERGKKELLAGVEDIKQKSGLTNTSGAIREMTKMFEEKKRSVPRVGIVITDGASTRDAQYLPDSAKAAQDKGITMVAVGVGNNIPQEELDIISNNDSTNKIQISDFKKLASFTETLAKKACKGRS